MTKPQKEKLAAALKQAADGLRKDWEKGVVEYVKSHPKLTFDQIGAEIGITKGRVSQICVKHGWHRPRGHSSPASIVQRSKKK